MVSVSNFFKNLSPLMLLNTFAICALGLLFVFSASYSPASPFSFFFKKQLFGMFIGVCVYILFAQTDYRWLVRHGELLHYAAIGLLILTILKGKMGMGAQRWIHLGLFQLQPSELVKLTFPCFFISEFYRNVYGKMHGSTVCLKVGIVSLLTLVLILRQPDLGTAVIFAVCVLLLLWISGLRRKILSRLLIIGLVAAPLGWQALRPYQKKRILTFVGQGDSKKEGYHIEQSKIAIGSGGITGKGFTLGTQNKLLFLPESRTDFVFAVLCEEWGLLGALLLILLYCLLTISVQRKIKKIQGIPEKILGLGVFSHISISFCINVLMTVGLLPVVGVPLPLVSSGISNLLVSFASLGIIANICRPNH